MQKFSRYLAFIVVALFVLTACSVGKAPPQVVISPTEFDFGDIGPQAVTTTFVVSNLGGRLLKVESLTTSCGCTTAEISAQTIAPGDSATLTVNFDPQVHAGATGQFLRYIFLNTNDPENPELQVQIVANVVANPASQEVTQ